MINKSVPNFPLAATAHFPTRGRVTVTFGEPLNFRFEEPAEIVAAARQKVEKL